MSTETSLWAWLAAARKSLVNLDLRRVENAIEGGTPDVEGCLDGSQFWIELKCSRANLMGVVRFKFRPAQVPWLKKRQDCGGRAFVLAQVDDGHRARRYLVNGIHAHLMASDEGIPEIILADLNKLSSPQDDAIGVLKAAAGRVSRAI